MDMMNDDGRIGGCRPAEGPAVSDGEGRREGRSYLRMVGMSVEKLASIQRLDKEVALRFAIGPDEHTF